MNPNTMASAIVEDRKARGVSTDRTERALLRRICAELLDALRARGRRVLAVDEGASLTDRQHQMVRILQDRADAGLPMPSQSELAAAMGLSSVAQVHGIKHAIERLGWIEIAPGRHRAITLLKRLPKRRANHGR